MKPKHYLQGLVGVISIVLLVFSFILCFLAWMSYVFTGAATYYLVDTLPRLLILVLGSLGMTLIAILVADIEENM